jgi:hypothetical protein
VPSESSRRSSPPCPRCSSAHAKFAPVSRLSIASIVCSGLGFFAGPIGGFAAALVLRDHSSSHFGVAFGLAVLPGAFGFVLGIIAALTTRPRLWPLVGALFGALAVPVAALATLIGIGVGAC